MSKYLILNYILYLFNILNKYFTTNFDIFVLIFLCVYMVVIAEVMIYHKKETQALRTKYTIENIFFWYCRGEIAPWHLGGFACVHIGQAGKGLSESFSEPLWKTF